MEGFFMSKEPKETTQKPNDPTARRETAREIYEREASANPRFKEGTNSGRGFVIVGARPSAGKPDDAQPSETPRYIATAPKEPTFLIIDLDRLSVPAPVPTGPFGKDTEQLVAACMAAYPALTREKTIEALWAFGGI
jgi:hypothetical protein